MSGQILKDVFLNMFIVVARRRRKDGRTRRQRTTFSNQQTLSLEMEYQRAEYISRSRRCELAQRLSLTETQVKYSHVVEFQFG